MTSHSRRLGRGATRLLAAALAVALSAGPALAHGGSLGGGGREQLTIPLWLVLSTGGAAVGASFLLASLVTDRTFIRAIDGWRRRLPAPGRALVGAVRALGVLVVLVTVAVGFAGPGNPRTNLGLLVVWVGWWAGYTMTTYLVGNTWRALNPWRTVVGLLPSLDRDYPDRLGAWPATAALLAFIWLEVVSPLSDAPRFLAAVVVVYSVVTLAGAVAFGESWFRRADPVSRVFDHYGRVAPLRIGDGTPALRLPGSALTDLSLPGRGEVAFVVALLWVTTFDGLVSTAAWAGVADAATGVGLPLFVLYPAVLVGGFAAFLAVFVLAARVSRSTADTYLTAGELARQFAPSLLAIAAGYHLAHYLGYFLTFAPMLGSATLSPLASPAQVPVLPLPGWFDLVGMAAILVGHLLAIWVAHARAYDLFPGRLQAIRSQYPFVAVMVFYTMTSLWLLTQPEVPTP